MNNELHLDGMGPNIPTIDASRLANLNASLDNSMFADWTVATGLEINTCIPEPATVGLCLIGIAMLLACRSDKSTYSSLRNPPPRYCCSAAVRTGFLSAAAKPTSQDASYRAPTGRGDLGYVRFEHGCGVISPFLSRCWTLRWHRLSSGLPHNSETATANPRIPRFSNGRKVMERLSMRGFFHACILGRGI